MAPPPPFSIGRFHSKQINALYISEDNERLYSGDSEGLVVCTLTRTFRALVSWQAHKEGILTLAEWSNMIITYAIENQGLSSWLDVFVNERLGSDMEETINFTSGADLCYFTLYQTLPHPAAPDRTLLKSSTHWT